MTTLIIWQQGSHKCWAAWPGLGAASCSAQGGNSPHCCTQHTALDSQVYTETASPGYNERAEIRLVLYSVKQLRITKYKKRIFKTQQFYLKYIMMCRNSINLCHPKGVARNINNNVVKVLVSFLSYCSSHLHD